MNDWTLGKEDGCEYKKLGNVLIKATFAGNYRAEFQISCQLGKGIDTLAHITHFMIKPTEREALLALKKAVRDIATEIDNTLTSYDKHFKDLGN